jgi:hypothetical protein
VSWGWGWGAQGWGGVSCSQKSASGGSLGQGVEGTQERQLGEVLACG